MGPSKSLIRGVAAVFVLAACGAGGGSAPPPLTLAATTTLEDSGLLAELVAAFRAAHPEVRVRTLTGGTGEVLTLGRNRDVDVVLSHDPVAESTFVAEGHGIERREVMWNDFVIAGPPSDPAGVRGLRDAAAAFAAIARARSPFVSRGDDSGTHRKERHLWREAGTDIEERSAADGWYIVAGVGMGDALRLADARRAYVLTDRATYRVLRRELELEILVEGDARLLNPYGSIRVRDAAHTEAAATFVDWLTSPEGRRFLSEFGRDRYREPLYFTDARPGG